MAWNIDNIIINVLKNIDFAPQDQKLHNLYCQTNIFSRRATGTYSYDRLLFSTYNA